MILGNFPGPLIGTSKLAEALWGRRKAFVRKSSKYLKTEPQASKLLKCLVIWRISPPGFLQVGLPKSCGVKDNSTQQRILL
jgi:hypothetical protein